MPARFNLAVSPRLRTTRFHDRVVAAGAQALSVYNHMLLPVVYESWEADYPHLLERVQLWDLSVERQVESRGRDALALVELMTPRDIARCAVGQCMYAPLVDEHGGIVSDPLILRLAGDRFWVSIADSDVLLWAKGLAAGKGFDADVRGPDVSPLALQGPLADEVAEAVSVPGFPYLGLTCMCLVHPSARSEAGGAQGLSATMDRVCARGPRRSAQSPAGGRMAVGVARRLCESAGWRERCWEHCETASRRNFEGPRSAPEPGGLVPFSCSDLGRADLARA